MVIMGFLAEAQRHVRGFPMPVRNPLACATEMAHGTDPVLTGLLHYALYRDTAAHAVQLHPVQRYSRTSDHEYHLTFSKKLLRRVLLCYTELERETTV